MSQIEALTEKVTDVLVGLSELDAAPTSCGCSFADGYIAALEQFQNVLNSVPIVTGDLNITQAVLDDRKTILTLVEKRIDEINEATSEGEVNSVDDIPTTPAPVGLSELLSQLDESGIAFRYITL